MAVTASALRDTLKDPPQDTKSRKDLYNAALETVFALESQQDTAQRLYHGHVPLALAQTGTDLQLFELVSKQSDKAWTLEELADTTKSDPVLLCTLVVPN
jgi:hypothetical protein